MEHPDFAERFNLAVQQAGVKDSLEALARLLDVSPVTVWSYKTGSKLPRISTARRIARTLGVSTEWLIDGTGRGPNEGDPQSVSEPQATYGYESLKGLPDSARELVQLIIKESKAGNLAEEHIELLTSNIRLMTGRKK